MDLKEIKDLYKRYLKLRDMIDPDGSKKQYREHQNELYVMQEELLDSIEYLLERIDGAIEKLQSIVKMLEEVRYGKDI